MGTKLTERAIERLTCPPGKRDSMTFDTEQRGLAVRVMASGTKSYLVQYSHLGRKRRVPLGSTDAISLATARDAARVAMGRVAQGIDPAAERKAAVAATKADALRERTTVARLVTDWQRLHLAHRRESYRDEAPRVLKRALAGWWERPAEALRRDDLVGILDGLSPSMKRALKAYGSACFSWGQRRGAVPGNPFADLPVRLSTARRDRVLSDAEVARVWKAALATPPPYGPIVAFLLLTAQRRDEVGGMVWFELSDDLSVWTIAGERTKNGQANIVPLCTTARGLLGGPPRRRGGLVFPGEGGKRFGGWSKAKLALDEASGITGWTLHDLRRTAATGLQRLGVRLEVTEAILNHVSGSQRGVGGIYRRHDWMAEKVAALEAWASHVVAIAGVQR